jgi:hypothetical protein
MKRTFRENAGALPQNRASLADEWAVRHAAMRATLGLPVKRASAKPGKPGNIWKA